ncbi:Transcriptional regulator, LysR family [Oscillospiraceae bacterium]|nr:Transcriptional regulator, LysR family [Oscillospiraceae bacterium]
MRISDIRNIIVISEIKNFNKASAYLHISQPALSQSVKRLEESLGSQLFIRNKKTVSLSAAGEEFIKEGSKILQIYDRMIMNIGHNQEKNEPIRIAASSVYARRYFPEIFKTFRSLHPEVELKMVEMQNKSRLQSLLELDVDFAVMRTQEIPSVQYTRIFEEELLFVVSEELAMSRQQYIFQKDGREYVNLAGFEDVPFLSYPETNTMNRATVDLCLEAGFIPNVIYETTDSGLLANLISCGMGVGFIVGLSKATERENLSLRYYHIDNPIVMRSYMLAWNAENQLDNARKDLINIIKTIH